MSGIYQVRITSAINDNILIRYITRYVIKEEKTWYYISSSVETIYESNIDIVIVIEIIIFKVNKDNKKLTKSPSFPVDSTKSK